MKFIQALLETLIVTAFVAFSAHLIDLYVINIVATPFALVFIGGIYLAGRLAYLTSREK